MIKRIWKHKNFKESLQAAIEGIGIVLKTERNSKAIFVMGIIAFVAGLALRISPVEMMFVIMIGTSVFLCELFNTLVENILDLIKPQTDPHIRILKDISSAAVLIASLASIAIGSIIFLPKIISLFAL